MEPEGEAAPPPQRSVAVNRSARMIIGFSFAALAAAYVIGALQFRWGTIQNPGPALFPVLVGTGAFLVGLATGVEGLLRRHIEDGDPGPVGGKRLLLAVGALLLFVVGLPFLGFTLVSIGLVLVMQQLYGSTLAWWKRVLLALGTVLGIELFMTGLFGFDFPGGLVGLVL